MALVPCVDCGKEVSTIAVACPNCGRPVDHPQEESPETVNATEPQADSWEIAENELFPTESEIQESPTDVSEQNEVQYKGIGGWLQLFIVALFFCRPFGFFITQGKFTDLPPDLVNVLKTIAYVDMGIGFIIGILLGCKLGIAPRITQLYLAALVVSNLIFPFFLPSILGRAIPQNLIYKEVIVQLIYSVPAVIWIIYFSVSKRVKATYYSSE